MAEETLIGNDLKFQIGDASSPPEFSDLCVAFDVGEVGEEKSLEDITTLCDNIRKYRNGLADGMEIPLQTNVEMQDADIRTLYAAYKDNTEVPFRLITKAPLPEDSFTFIAIVRGWRLASPVGTKGIFTFTLKITSEVLWDQSVVTP